MRRPQLPCALMACLAVTCLVALARAADEDLDAFGQLAAQAVGYEFRALPEGFERSPVMIHDEIARMELSAEFQPPADAPRRVHFADETTCDAIATAYSVDDRPVRFVQLRGVAFLAIDVGELEFSSPETALQFVRGIVVRTLRDTSRINLTVEALPDGTFRGRQATQWASPKEGWETFDRFDSLQWWYDGVQLRLAFSLMRAGGALVWRPTFANSHYWFRNIKPGAPLPEGAPTGPPEGQ